MNMKPHPDPHHAILNLEGGDDEVVHIRAFGKDLGIEIRIDEEKTGVVIQTKAGMHRQAIDPETQGEVVRTYSKFSEAETQTEVVVDEVAKKASGRGAPGPEPPIPRGLPGDR